MKNDSRNLGRLNIKKQQQFPINSEWAKQRCLTCYDFLDHFFLSNKMHSVPSSQTVFLFFSHFNCQNSIRYSQMTLNLICWLLCMHALHDIDIMNEKNSAKTIHKIGLFGHFGGVQCANQLYTSFCCIVIKTTPEWGCMSFGRLHDFVVVVVAVFLLVGIVNCAIAYDRGGRP